ncbi:Stearoyl-CoA desaturase 5 [Fukomys damarensis]|uniref:Stearoyl-CoA desaturase 5 n=1 Tax=Fukomys damarensis TaxID=885580 RepID=A0A091E3H0_FUKDA|nr:Stearoyl-CoA desaturase 5 [Fukomys damarensis]
MHDINWQSKTILFEVLQQASYAAGALNNVVITAKSKSHRAGVLEEISFEVIFEGLDSFEKTLQLKHRSGAYVVSEKYYKTSVVLMCFLVPTLVPWYIWGESLWNSYFLAAILRYAVALNGTWLVNSVAHMYGNRPYDRHISPRQNPLVTLGAIEREWNGADVDESCDCFDLTCEVENSNTYFIGLQGEGFHNYHHTFPFDYSASEFGLNFNPTTWFIDFMCLLGLATDRKRATKPMIEARKAKTGDGSA